MEIKYPTTMPYPIVVSLFLLVSGVNGWSSTERVPLEGGYNFVVILTDDQDVILNGLTPMTKTLQHIANKGITFANAFTSSPICCPSRSSLLTGKYAHNHRTFNNSHSGGCYDRFWRKSIEPFALPSILSEAGYETFFAGKYLNEYFSTAVPPGWSQWFGLHGNSRYFNFTVNENGIPTDYANEYFTDYLHSKARDFLMGMSNNRSFFAMIAPPAPHAPYTPASRHEDLFPDVKAIRTPNFNVSSNELEKHWLLTMRPATLPSELINEIDSIHRKRWQTLMAVDEMVNDIVDILEAKQILNKTYIFFTSDNGYHLGQFSQAYDKRQPYETDIRVPLLVRGPSIDHKIIQESAVALIDIAPTILQLAGLDIPFSMDGKPLPLDREVLLERQILVEYWGEGNDETYNPECPWRAQDRLNLCTIDAGCHCQDAWNNTYNCVRHIGENLNFIYCEFKDTESFVEAYDISTDLYQMNNIGYEILPSIRAKYSIALQNLTACIGPKCHTIY